MLENNFNADPAISIREIWYSVYQALENEICLDKYFRATRTTLHLDDNVPNYKLMRQLAIRSRLGFCYKPFIALTRLAIPILAMFQWVYSIVVATIKGGRASKATLHIISKTSDNVSLIEGALHAESNLTKQVRDRDLLSIAKLSKEIGFSAVMFCVLNNFRLFRHILQADSNNRTDLLLHSRDAFTLLLLVSFVQRHPKHVYATDSHYQRWAFLLSHYCEDFRIVQHGILGVNIPFTHAFGRARTVYVRDVISKSAFASYYQVLDSKVFSPVRDFKINPFSATAIFLASSFPSIDDEIELLKRIKAELDIPVIVKFHPVHTYDTRKQELKVLASYICSDGEYPMCKIFVSHSSSMEWDYQSHGITSFGIARLGGVEDAAKIILDHLKSTCDSNFTKLIDVE